MTPITIKLRVLDNSDVKKHSVKYTEMDDQNRKAESPIIGTAYIRKDRLPKPHPEEVTVTLNW